MRLAVTMMRVWSGRSSNGTISNTVSSFGINETSDSRNEQSISSIVPTG
jgi:hypothetical protein